MDNRWHPIEPLDTGIEAGLRHELAALDRLHHLWREFAASLGEEDRTSLRRRTLRKHAIETGILERLYVVDWGVTDTLVAEGLTGEAVARSGGELSPGVMPMLKAQFEGLNMVTDYVRDEYPLTTSFIKELHALMTRAQEFYEATDALGRPVQSRLNHGMYKTLPNNVIRSDGTLLEFAPPEQVPGEVEQLVDWFNSMNDTHPIVSAAWLHHRFVQIHPFQDGNGRVARALTLATLGKAQYPPIVVSRDDRSIYLDGLDKANNGNLAELGRLFAKLAIRSVRRELGYPSPRPRLQTYREVTRAFAQSLDRRDQEEAEQKKRSVQLLAEQVHAHISDWLQKAGEETAMDFGEVGRKVDVWNDGATPDDDIAASPYKQPKSKWWRNQIIRTANRADHFANLASDTWWSMLRVTVNGLQMRFLTSIHHVGRHRGIMAVTSFADIRSKGDNPIAYEDTFVETSWDAFTFIHSEEIEDRAEELNGWLNQSLTVAMGELMRHTLGG